MCHQKPNTFQQNFYCSWIIRSCSFTTNSINTSSIFRTIYTFLKHSTINDSLFLHNQIWKNKKTQNNKTNNFYYIKIIVRIGLFELDDKNPKVNLAKYSLAVKKNVLNHESQLIFFHVFFLMTYHCILLFPLHQE